jgi:hypothetical protein
VRSVLDALHTTFLLWFLAWIVVIVPTSAALARRLGWDVRYGALLGLFLPPGVGWLAVWWFARRQSRIGPPSRKAWRRISSAVVIEPTESHPKWEL